MAYTPDVIPATSSSAGTMSAADKAKLDGIASGATSVALSSTTPAALGTSAVGTGTTAARTDHVHQYPILSLSNVSFTTAVLLVGGSTLQTYTVTGATIGMGVVVNPRAATALAAQMYAYVSAANTVTVAITALVAIGSTSINLDIRVIP